MCGILARRKHYEKELCEDTSAEGNGGVRRGREREREREREETKQSERESKKQKEQNEQIVINWTANKLIRGKAFSRHLLILLKGWSRAALGLPDLPTRSSGTKAAAYIVHGPTHLNFPTFRNFQ